MQWTTVFHGLFSGIVPPDLAFPPCRPFVNTISPLLITPTPGSPFITTPSLLACLA